MESSSHHTSQPEENDPAEPSITRDRDHPCHGSHPEMMRLWSISRGSKGEYKSESFPLVAKQATTFYKPLILYYTIRVTATQVHWLRGGDYTVSERLAEEADSDNHARACCIRLDGYLKTGSAKHRA